MAWSTPKTDWSSVAADVVADTDLNRIEANEAYLEEVARGSGGNVASASALVIDADNDFFIVTGTTQINTIVSTGRRAGSRITLGFADTLTLYHTSAATADTLYIYRVGVGTGDITTAAKSAFSFVFDGTQWRYIS